MAIDLELLSAPLSADAPAGPDLSYEPSRQQIEAAFERSISEDAAASEDIDWRGTIALILDEAQRTRDIWLPIYLMRAGARSGSLDSVEDGAALLAALVENLWDSVHPELSDYGFQGRKGPCESLTRRGEFLLPLSGIVLLAHPRLGRFTGADFQRFRENGDAEDGYGMFRAAIEGTTDEELQAIAARIGGVADSIRRVDEAMTAAAVDDTSTNFQPTYEALEGIRRSVVSFLRAGGEEQLAADAAEEGAPSSVSEPVVDGRGSFSGAIRSREDVVRAIDAISAYYTRFEPASPVPFALRRAREWVSLDFLEVLEDIAPGSIDEARRILQTQRSAEAGESSGGGGSNSGW